MTTEFLLIRHGETIWNAEARMQGQQDSPLTARGRAQALAVADRLGREHFDGIYASDLQRVIDTAQPLADATGHAIRLEPQLRERHYGIFEGLTYADMAQQHSDLYERYRAARYDPDFVIPEAETIRQLVGRGMAIFDAFAERHAGERVAIFSHGGTLAAVLRTVLGVPLDGKHGFRMANGSISTIGYEEGEWRVLTLGEVTHLSGIA